MVYLDDGIVAVQGLEAAKRSNYMVKDTLVNVGFVTHVEKSMGFLLNYELVWL